MKVYIEEIFGNIVCLLLVLVSRADLLKSGYSFLNVSGIFIGVGLILLSVISFIKEQIDNLK